MKDCLNVQIPVCENDNEDDIRKIYDFDDNARNIRVVHHFNLHRYEHDPDGLLGSNLRDAFKKKT